jgi:two-component system, NarL family, sensor histidine kinase DegS
LTNALAHAQATQIQVALDLAQDHVQATVEDNGSGFNVDDTLKANNNTIGLASLRERIEMLGGEINIQSSLGHGTRVQFSIPITTERY